MSFVVRNAPVPCEEHALAAVRSAVEMHEWLVTQQPLWAARGFPPLEIRCGVHTASVWVGNLGSPERESSPRSLWGARRKTRNVSSGVPKHTMLEKQCARIHKLVKTGVTFRFESRAPKELTSPLWEDVTSQA